MSQPDAVTAEPPGAPAPDGAAPTFRRARRPRRKLFLVLAALGVVIVVVFGVVKVLYKPYRLVSPSMSPTLAMGDRILVSRGSYTPKNGDVVAIHPPREFEDFEHSCAGGQPATGTMCLTPGHGQLDTTVIERVVGSPGDRIELRNGRVWRGGRSVDSLRIETCDFEECNLKPFTVPAGTWITLGDKRGNAQDTRFWGPVRKSNFAGRVVATYWPPSHIGSVR